MEGAYVDQVVERMLMEFDARSPRLRLSVVGYLTEAGYLPTQPGFISKLQEILDWVTADINDHVEQLKSLKDDESQAALPGFGPVRNGYDILRAAESGDARDGYL